MPNIEVTPPKRVAIKESMYKASSLFGAPINLHSTRKNLRHANILNKWYIFCDFLPLFCAGIFNFKAISFSFDH